MKSIEENFKTISIVISVLFFFQSANAQFLKKLKDRVQETVENVIIEKTAEKAAEKTGDGMDKILNMDFSGIGKTPVDPNTIPESYDFTWKYSLQMQTTEGDMVLDYFLMPDQPYFGFESAPMKDMFMVMDTENKMTVIYLDTEGNSSIMAVAIPDDVLLDEMNGESEDFSYEILANKTIMGYDCKGVKATNEELEMTMYFTTDAEVSFRDIYKSDNANIPKGLKKYFKEGENTLMLELEMVNYKKEKLNASMKCVGLEKIQKVVNKSDYESMNYLADE